MYGSVIYDHDSEEGTGPALRTGIPGARRSGSFCPASKLDHQATLQFLGYTLFGAPKLTVSLSALDCVDCMSRTLGRFYKCDTRVKTFGN